MVLLVHGFPSNIAALQFEWAWQNPHLSRQAPLESKLLLRTQHAPSRLSLIQKVEALREMLGFEGWRRWPLKVSILDEEVAKVWVKVGEKEGIRNVEWSIIGEDIVNSDVEEERSKQEQKRDLNLKKLKTLDLTDCIPLLYSLN